jgi:hypothetical protein
MKVGPMSEKERLHIAVAKTMAAGYQLDLDAFTFLSAIAATDDPTIIITEALARIEELPEKPVFIGRCFLEKVLKKVEGQGGGHEDAVGAIISLSDLERFKEAFEEEIPVGGVRSWQE